MVTMGPCVVVVASTAYSLGFTKFPALEATHQCSARPLAGTGRGAILTPDGDFTKVMPVSDVSAHTSILWTIPEGGSSARWAAVITDTRDTTVPGVGTGIFPNGIQII